MSDLTDIDVLPNRIIIDEILKGYGEPLIEFLNDSKQCVLNGRFSHDCNNYTCISHKGKSGVDCILMPHVFSKCSDFPVITSNDTVQMYGLQELFSTKCKPSDLSILACSFPTMHILTKNIGSTKCQMIL